MEIFNEQERCRIMDLLGSKIKEPIDDENNNSKEENKDRSEHDSDVEEEIEDNSDNEDCVQLLLPL